jgi:hypothetical protein
MQDYEDVFDLFEGRLDLVQEESFVACRGT